MWLTSATTVVVRRSVVTVGSPTFHDRTVFGSVSSVLNPPLDLHRDHLETFEAGPYTGWYGNDWEIGFNRVTAMWNGDPGLAASVVARGGCTEE